MKEILTIENNEDELRNWASLAGVTVIESKEMRGVILELKEIVREKGLAGLSAPQIGYDMRVIVINFNGDIRTFVNPIIVESSGMEMSQETCSSIPGKEFIIPRANRLKILYQKPTGKESTEEFFGMAAKVFQHHLDHLNGMLVSDIGMEIDDDFRNASDDEKVTVINMYLESLDMQEKQLKEEIQNDKELKQTWDAIEFMNAVNEGKIEVVPRDEEGNLIENGDNTSNSKIIEFNKSSRH